MPRNITEKDCRAEVKKRCKLYDKDCRGLYVSLSPTAPPTFSLKYTHPLTKKRAVHRLGVYDQQQSNVAHWRKQAAALKVRIANGSDIAAAARQATAIAAKQAEITVDALIDKFIAWISAEIEETKHTEHGVIIKRKPRMKSHQELTGRLNRFVRPRLGPMLASEVTNRDIAQLQRDIIAGDLIIKGRKMKKGTVSGARHMRKAVSALFKWASEVGNDYVSTSPCFNLPKLPKEAPRKRKLSREEIKLLWRGLDRPDITKDRRICLALKFALCSMLRTWEFLHIHESELQGNGLADKLPLVIIPEERVKPGHELHAPLSDLAVEVAKEAMGNYTWMFAGRWGTEPLSRKAVSNVLRGRSVVRKGKPTRYTEGLCEKLGIAKFTPHDLRRTAASLMANIGISRATIALCLDHAIIKDDDQRAVPAVTGKHYDLDPRIAEKRAALQKLADEIRRIVAEEPQQELEQPRRIAA
jgi:integrase